MRKGLIFTIDAVYGVIFIVALAAAFTFYYNASATNSVIIENLNQKTMDAALVALYLNKNATDFNAIKNNFVDANHSKCTTIYEYDLGLADDDSANQATISTKKFCGGIG